MSEWGDHLREIHQQRETKMAARAANYPAPSESFQRLFPPQNASVLRRRMASEIPPPQRAKVSTAAKRQQRQAIRRGAERDLLRKQAGLMTSAEVSIRTGATKRQLQWWDERGIISPQREAHTRLYTGEQAADVAKLVQLRRCGVPLKDCRKLLKVQFREVRRAKKGLLIGDVLVVA